MTTRIIAVVTLVAFLNGILGCSSVILLRPDELKKQPQKNILAAKLTSGEEINFESPGGVFAVEKQVLQGTIRDTTFITPSQFILHTEDLEITLDDIRYVTVRKFNTGRTLGCIFGTTALGIGLYFLILSQIEFDFVLGD